MACSAQPIRSRRFREDFFGTGRYGKALPRGSPTAGVSGAMMLGMIDRYIDDDAGFRGWLAAHRGGYVLNADRDAYSRRSSSSDPNLLRLHLAHCRHWADIRDNWTRDYVKACARDRFELELWCSDRLGAPPKPCEHCMT